MSVLDFARVVVSQPAVLPMSHQHRRLQDETRQHPLPRAQQLMWLRRHPLQFHKHCKLWLQLQNLQQYMMNKSRDEVVAAAAGRHSLQQHSHSKGD